MLVLFIVNSFKDLLKYVQVYVDLESSIEI